MKFFVTALMLASFSCYSGTEKSPEKVDISVKDIIQRTCLMSGYFNQLACESDIMECYEKYSWPKTVYVELKVDVVISCGYSVIRR
jgi:hypothetical protein